jgi:protein-tyrosine phosphatase
VLDLHNHVLFGLDDGCRDPEESRALAEAARALGHEGFVATPHIRPGIFDNDPDGIRRRRDETRPIVEAAGLELHLGAEYYFDEHFLEAGKAKALLTLGERTRYVLAELPRTRLPLRWEDVLYEVRLRGYVPVIAHPERCGGVAEDIEGALEGFRRAGALLQLDLGSLVGHYGRGAQRAAEKLVKAGAYHVAAGDLHRPEDPAKILEPAKKALDKLARKRRVRDAVTRLVVENPRRVVEDASPETIPAV